MKKILRNVTLLIMAASLFSCDKELEENDSKPVSFNAKTISGITVVNGRLAFPSLEVLKTTFKDCSEKSDEDMASIMDGYFDMGFASLRPIVTADNALDIIRIYDTILPITPGMPNKYDIFDEVENLIGDDTFAALLNYKGEILVGDKIYKYTELGMFGVDESEYGDLTHILNQYNISELPYVPTDPQTGDDFLEILPSIGGTTTPVAVPCMIEYHLTSSTSLVSVDPGCSDDYAPPVNPYNITPNAHYSDPDFQDFENSLVNCGTPEPTFIGQIINDLFGDDYKCIDQYNSHRRVKTKAYNYHYILVYSLGAKVKHQYHNTGVIWQKEESPEVKLVVECAQWEYDLTPYTNVDNSTNFFANNFKVNATDISNMVYTKVPFDMDGLPKLIKNDLAIEAFKTGNVWLDNQIQNGINDATEASNLNEYFYNLLFDQTQSLLGQVFPQYTVPEGRTFLAKYPQYGKVILQRSDYEIGYGVAKRERIFDWGAQLCFSSNSDWDFSATSCSFEIVPKNFRIKLLGGARDGDGNWHGGKFSVGLN